VKQSLERIKLAQPNKAYRALKISFWSLVFVSVPGHGLAAAEPTTYESTLLRVIETMQNGHLDPARILVESLLTDYPHSRTAKLLYADILATQGGRLPLGERTIHTRERAALDDLQNQLQVRWRYQSSQSKPNDNLLPSRLLLPGRDTHYLIYVDLPESRLYVYRHQKGRLIHLHNYYVTIGKNGIGKQIEGDRKTPVGVYRITSFIPDAELPPRYGPGALPIDYPNSIDRMTQRTGYGIWLHGTEPGYVNRGPYASDGCVTLSNHEFEHLREITGNATDIPVILDHAPVWLTRKDLPKRRANAIAAVQQWHSSWLRIDKAGLAKVYRAMNAAHLEEALRNPSQERPLSPLTADWNYPTIPDIELMGYPHSIETFLARLTFKNADGSRLIINQYWQHDANKNWQVMAERRHIQ
jgi:lipoprotein-anchoring transpeptidase ErfK/SrfK